MADPRLTFLAILLAGLPVLAQAGPGLDRVTVPNSAHRKLVNRVPLRVASPDLAMERMQLVLKMAPDAAASLKQLLKDQQDPSSSRYHQWLSPEQFGQQFGPSQAQRDAASLWLLQQGFTIDATAKSGLAVTFSGSAGQVAKAFQTSIMEYDVNGVVHHGNAANISLPRSLAGFVAGVASLNDLRRQVQPRFQPLQARGQGINKSGDTFIGPGDFAKIYDLTPLYGNGNYGQGVTIGIVGQTDIGTTGVSDWNSFRTTFGLGSTGTLTVTDTSTPPGIVDPGDAGESELDTQWATATAPGANVILAVSPSSVTTGGINLSAQYLVDNDVAPIISLSYGECETDMGSTQATFWEQLWAQAAGQGISVFVSSGDSGAAGCDDPVDFTATGGRSVNGLGSSPFNTCVGGTEFTGTGSTYWSSSSTPTNGTTALGYVPEGAWNESSLDNGFRLFAGGGGVSTFWPKPSWQSAFGVPNDSMRDVPDVAFNASAINFPTAVVSGGMLVGVGGTSVATPCMAGIMALVIQSQGGQRQGNINPTLYALGRAQYAATGPSVFHDIGAGAANNNTVPGQTGYLCGTGYDLVTGLGSVDASLLVQNWTQFSNPIQVTVSAPASTSITVPAGQTVAFIGAATDSAATISTYQWSYGDGASTALASGTHAFTAAGTYTATLTASDGVHAQTSSPITVNVTAHGVSPVITLPVTASYAYPGATINFAAAASSANAGATSAFTYAWNFGDGTTATGASASHAFAENDTYFNVVTLTATDSTGATGTTTIELLSDPTYAMDCTGDGSIDVRDLLTLAAAWDPVLATPANLNGLNVWGDLNADGMVSDLDLQIWINHFAPVAQ